METKKIGNLEIRIFADLEELSHYASQFFVSVSRESNTFTVALSGGSTPKRMFELLATVYKKDIFWPKIHVFWTDERAETSNPSSNFQTALQSFLKHVLANAHPIRLELGLDRAVQEYSRQIDDLAPAGFDLAFNGAGSDGHRNGTMPESPKINWKNNIWDLPESVKAWGYMVPPETNPYTGRITLTPWFLNKSKTNVLVLAGEAKAELLREITIDKEKYSKQELPALTFNDVPTIVLADKMAASKI